MTDTDQTQTQNGTNTRPKPQDKSPHRRRYPYDTIEVGESFAYGPELNGVNAYSFARDASIKLGKKFRVSKVRDGFRCWRLR